ncbi:uncharacterized protein ACBT44_021102 isoform 3-T5 [Syngnathus typhle]
MGQSACYVCVSTHLITPRRLSNIVKRLSEEWRQGLEFHDFSLMRWPVTWYASVKSAIGRAGFKESYQMQAPPTAWRFLGIQGELSNTGATDRVAVSRPLFHHFVWKTS